VAGSDSRDLENILVASSRGRGVVAFARLTQYKQFYGHKVNTPVTHQIMRVNCGLFLPVR
jgi:hypothetical protein